MRSILAAAFVMTLASLSPAMAAPLGVPGAASYVWNNGEAKSFELTWDGALALFTVEDLGTSTYNSLMNCCTDTFDRVRHLHPSANLTFTDLAINTMPVNTVFVDNLNLSLLKKGALDNIGSLTGTVTLQWDDPFSRMPNMDFFVVPEGGITAEVTEVTVPEPATLLLIGSGLVGTVVRSRRRRS